MSRNLFLSLLIVSSGLLLSCNDTSQVNSPDNLQESDQTSSDDRQPENMELPLGFEDVVDRVWELRQFTDVSGEIEETSDDMVYQLFLHSQDAEFTAFSVCVLSTEGIYAVSDGYLSLSYGNTDGIVCVTEDDPNYEQGRRIAELLQRGPEFKLMYEVIGNLLTLTAANGRYLQFEEVQFLRLE